MQIRVKRKKVSKIVSRFSFLQKLFLRKFFDTCNASRSLFPSPRSCRKWQICEGREKRRGKGRKETNVFLFFFIFYEQRNMARVIHLSKLPRIAINFFFHRFEADWSFERSSGVQRLVKHLFETIFTIEFLLEIVENIFASNEWTRLRVGWDDTNSKISAIPLDDNNTSVGITLRAIGFFFFFCQRDRFPGEI